MSNSWTDDVDTADDPEESTENGFTTKLQTHVEDGVASEIDEIEYADNLEEVEDEELLRRAYIQMDGNGHSEKKNLVENRINALGGEVTGEDDSGSPEPAIETAEEIEDDSQGEEEENDSQASQGTSENSRGPPEPESGMTLEETQAIERRWKVLCWGPPKIFKTHMGFTMPEPIAFLDLEGKADDVAGKFSDKDIRVWQPKRMEAEPDTKFRRAKKALNEALEWLDWYWENEDQRGTIVVDSMSLMWEWAQIHHKIENYPLKDPETVELSANFKSSQESDWAVIKEYHNGEFRDRITDSPYHFYWTAMQRVEFEESLSDDENRRFLEPTGEPKNDYKADTIIRARKNKDRGKVGDLVGSNFTDNVFVGLTRPTFPDVREAIEAIEQAEAGDEAISRSDLADEIGVDAVINYDPQVYVQDNE